MKGKILPFIIGMLIGAIIATSGFLIYERSKTSEESVNSEQNEENLQSNIRRR